MGSLFPCGPGGRPGRVEVERPKRSDRRRGKSDPSRSDLGIYQAMIAAYREPDRARGCELMVELIDSLSSGVPKLLTELVTLGRTLTKRSRRAGLLRPTRREQRTTEAINGRLEHLRGCALGFGNLTDYVAR
jgi:transposase